MNLGKNMDVKILTSEIDRSINFVFDNKMESRFVQRDNDYFIVYLSSHTGCDKACRFCHLTQSGQTDMISINKDEFIQQAKYVLQHYQENGEHKDELNKIHYNFMARGEFFSNDYILNNAQDILDSIKNLQEDIIGSDIKTVFNVSTILPLEVDVLKLRNILTPNDENYLYYSLYHIDNEKRKKWLPKSLNVNRAFEKLSEYKNDGGNIYFHHCFIEGFNDSLQDVYVMCDKIVKSGLNINSKFNLVRYNPYSEKQGKESHEDVIMRNMEVISSIFTEKSRIVPRVGFDVKASCGMFV
jgi:23S rRNA (adenine2503-C2)-methyltransferase